MLINHKLFLLILNSHLLVPISMEKKVPAIILLVVYLLVVVCILPNILPKTVWAQESAATPSIIIAFVGNITPRYSIDSVSVAGITANAGDGYTVTVDWGDGTNLQSKEIPISSGGKWGPVYHKYNSAAVNSNPHLIVAILEPQSSADINLYHPDPVSIIKSEPYSINVQKKVAFPLSDLTSNNIIGSNDPINHLPDWTTIITMTVIGAIVGCSMSTYSHHRSGSHKLIAGGHVKE
jgi:hypothetical protein